MRMDSVPAFDDGVEPMPGLVGILGIRVFAEDVIVVNLGGFPAMVALIIFGDVKAAARLLGLERFDQLLRLRHPRVLRMKGQKIGESGDGLGGNALVVFGGFGLFVVSLALSIKGVGA